VKAHARTATFQQLNETPGRRQSYATAFSLGSSKAKEEEEEDVEKTGCRIAHVYTKKLHVENEPSAIESLAPRATDAGEDAAAEMYLRIKNADDAVRLMTLMMILMHAAKRHTARDGNDRGRYECVQDVRQSNESSMSRPYIALYNIACSPITIGGRADNSSVCLSVRCLSGPRP